MKLAYVHTGKWPSSSPSSTFVTYNSAGLAKYCEQFHLLVKRNTSRSAEKVFKESFNLEKPKNLSVHKIRKPLINSNRFFYRKAFKIIEKLIQNEGLDAVITRRETFLPFMVKLRRRHNIKIYFESHDFFADLSVRNDINPKKKKKQCRHENKYIPKLDGLICLQENQKKLYSRIFPRQDIKVFRTGIPGYVKSDAEKKYTAYIGSLDPHKGTETLLEAAKLSKSRPSIIIIGGRREKKVQSFKNLIKDSFPELDITVTGWINKQQMDTLLKKTLIGIVPLRNTFYNMHITSPLKLFDYLSYGIPAVASDLPSTRELIEENRTGLFFSPEDPVDLAKKIDSLIFDKTKVNQMRDYIFNNTSHLLWETRARKIIEWLTAKKRQNSLK